MSVQPSEYFLSALEAQRSINTHIHEIEPTTPVVLYEIDLNEIKPATVTYPIINGPIKDGILRIHNDFNLFNINRGIIIWKGNYYFPFPVFGEQFDITSNGTIPTPKVKFSSQFLDDEFNSFYKYIRMQINELKDIVGSKVTRRKTFVRYLSPENFVGKVNPFNEFVMTPWASRDGDTLTVRTVTPIAPPKNMTKWIVYYPKTNFGSRGKVFTTLMTDDRLRTLNSYVNHNYTIESEDFFSLLINEAIDSNTEYGSDESSETFNINSLVFSGNNNNFGRFIPENQYEFRNISNNNQLKILCGTSTESNVNTQNVAIYYNVSFAGVTDKDIATFISLKSNRESAGNNINYGATPYTYGASINFSNNLTGSFDVNYLSLTTGFYTGINPFSKEDVKLAVINDSGNFGLNTSAEINYNLPFSFSSAPKILFNAYGTGSSGFHFNQYVKNITSSGFSISFENTGNRTIPLQTQRYSILLTDYIYEDLSPTGATQVLSSQANLATEYQDQMKSKNIQVLETELSPDIFYIDRKIQEDSTNVIYELASLLDIEGIKLPSRVLLSKNCPLTYRGEGCLYEYKTRLTSIHSGVYADVSFETVPVGSDISTRSISNSQKPIGLLAAPPVADASDNIFNGYIGQSNWIDRGPWKQGTSYIKNNFVYIEKNDIKYYFVCDKNNTANSINAPPNETFWKSDTCSKTLKGCRLRWRENPNFSEITFNGGYNFSAYSVAAGQNIEVFDKLISYKVRAPKDGAGKQLIGILPFGGFPSVEGKYQSQQAPPGGG